jgi:catechol 2,3-dioxygenase-like lactoylglutathione lyase family enzyme
MQGVLKPHLSLNVANVEASVAFYEKLFEVAPLKRRPGYAKFDLVEPALNLTMSESPKTGQNVSHFGIQVQSSEDVFAAKSRFESMGLRTFTEEQSTCCYALQDKVWVEDPDGNAWEVFVVLADADRMKVDVSNAGGAMCCAPKLDEAAKDAKAIGCGCA